MLPAAEMLRMTKLPGDARQLLTHETIAEGPNDVTLYILLIGGEAPIRLKLSFAYRYN